MKILTLSAILSFGISTIGTSVEFQDEIAPILKNRCGKCHMDGESKGKVALDPHLISRQIGSDGSIVPGDVKGSDLHWTLTLDPGEDSAMPPKGKRVPKEEIDLIAKWIEEGAKVGEIAKKTDAGPGMEESMSGESMNGAMTPGGMVAEKGSKPYKGIFKNKKGMQVPATLTRVDGDRAILILPDGKEYRYPINLFAADSKEIVQKFKAGTLDPSE